MGGGGECEGGRERVSERERAAGEEWLSLCSLSQWLSLLSLCNHHLSAPQAPRRLHKSYPTHGCRREGGRKEGKEKREGKERAGDKREREREREQERKRERAKEEENGKEREARRKGKRLYLKPLPRRENCRSRFRRCRRRLRLAPFHPGGGRRSRLHMNRRLAGAYQ